MKGFMASLAAGLCLSFGLPAAAEDAQPDADGCKDPQVLNRMPSFRITSCDGNQFDRKKFPTGPALPRKDDEGSELTPMPRHVEVEGPYTFYRYELREGVTKPSDLQIMRNFEAAAKKANALVGSYPGWCKAEVDESLADGNSCINHGVAMKFARGGKEIWAFMETADEGASYELHLMESKVMSQDIVASELFDKISKDGFIALYLNFDTGKASLQQDSLAQVDQIAEMLKKNASLKLEVAGHTDNVGNAKANQKLSEDRATTVMKALTQRGIPAARLTAKGHGQSQPISDNRTEDGRAKNRRVELVKR